MIITVSSVVKSVVPYSLTNYTGQYFRVTYSGVPYTGTFIDGTRDF